MKQHTKTLGQVFLHDHNIIKKIIAFSNPTPHSPIIEIGCGKGILTTALCKIGPTHVIEIDTRWINHVLNLNLPNCSFIHEDALKINYNQFNKDTPIIANIPYQITTPLIQHLATFKEHLGHLTIMIQKEVADRLLAQPNTKEYGAMTLFCQYHFNLTKGFLVSKHCFSPKPNIDSYVIKLSKNKGQLPTQNEPLFFAMTRTFFWGRRKTMLTCLKNGPYLNIIKPLPTHLIPILKNRAESQSLTDLLNLFESLSSYIAFKPNGPLTP